MVSKGKMEEERMGSAVASLVLERVEEATIGSVIGRVWLEKVITCFYRHHFLSVLVLPSLRLAPHLLPALH